MRNNKDFDFERLVQLFQADRGMFGHLAQNCDLLDIGDVMFSINMDTHWIGKSLEGIEKQLKRIADRYCGEVKESENERNTNND